MDTSDKRPKCTECGAYQPHHSPLCSQQTPEQWMNTAHVYYRAWLGRADETNKRLQEAAVHHERVKAQATFWQGKYAMVKQENNKLRKMVGREDTFEWQDIKLADKAIGKMLLHGVFNKSSDAQTVIGSWHHSFQGNIDKGWWVAGSLQFYPTHFCELLSDPR
jgi:hypothetical protein